MATREAAKHAFRTVKPILSTNSDEAHRRVINLYKAWYRQIPIIVKQFDMPKNEDQCREKLREMFYKYKDVTDVRVIDMLVIKGQMELKEIVMHWKQPCHIMAYWKDTVDPKPTDFLSKFFSGSG